MNSCSTILVGFIFLISFSAWAGGGAGEDKKPTLPYVPREIWQLVGQHLPNRRDLNNLALVNRNFNRTARDHTVREQVFRNQFQDIHKLIAEIERLNLLISRQSLNQNDSNSDQNFNILRQDLKILLKILLEKFQDPSTLELDRDSFYALCTLFDNSLHHVEDETFTIEVLNTLNTLAVSVHRNYPTLSHTNEFIMTPIWRMAFTFRAWDWLEKNFEKLKLDLIKSPGLMNILIFKSDEYSDDRYFDDQHHSNLNSEEEIRRDTSSLVLISEDYDIRPASEQIKLNQLAKNILTLLIDSQNIGYLERHAIRIILNAWQNGNYPLANLVLETLISRPLALPSMDNYLYFEKAWIDDLLRLLDELMIDFLDDHHALPSEEIQVIVKLQTYLQQRGLLETFSHCKVFLVEDLKKAFNNNHRDQMWSLIDRASSNQGEFALVAFALQQVSSGRLNGLFFDFLLRMIQLPHIHHVDPDLVSNLVYQLLERVEAPTLEMPLDELLNLFQSFIEVLSLNLDAEMNAEISERLKDLFQIYGLSEDLVTQLLKDQDLAQKWNNRKRKSDEL